MSDAYVEETDKKEGGDKRRLAVLWRLVPLISPHKGRFFLALVTLFAASGITLIYPWAAREAIDVGMGGRTVDDLDPRLETAAVEHLVKVDRRVRRARRK